MRRACFLLGLLGCGLWYLLGGSYLGWMLLLSMPALALLSLLFSLPAIFGFHMAPAGPEKLTVGETGTFLLAGSCNAPMPPFRGRLRLRNLRTGKSVLYDEALGFCPKVCGGWEIVPEKCRVFDYLGLFSLPVRHRDTQLLRVFPLPQPMEDLPELREEAAVSWKPSASSFGENHELRPYRPGDRLNTVHWKLTAKTGTLTVREPQEPIRETASLTLSLSGSDETVNLVLGQLLWLGTLLLERNMDLDIRAAAEQGMLIRAAATKEALWDTVAMLLMQKAAPDAPPPEPGPAKWHFCLGGTL